jgi:hypothetical protein
VVYRVIGGEEPVVEVSGTPEKAKV